MDSLNADMKLLDIMWVLQTPRGFSKYHINCPNTIWTFLTAYRFQKAESRRHSKEEKGVFQENEQQSATTIKAQSCMGSSIVVKTSQAALTHPLRCATYI